MTITTDQLTPGTRFRGNSYNDANGVCIVEEQPAAGRHGSYIGPEWVWAHAEASVKANRQGLIFHIDEIGEILPPLEAYAA